MPNIDVLVGEIEAAGFKYTQYVNLTVISYEYNRRWSFSQLRDIRISLNT
jgi:hypothetical protein